jgi:hypothetical protein
VIEIRGHYLQKRVQYQSRRRASCFIRDFSVI